MTSGYPIRPALVQRSEVATAAWMLLAFSLFVSCHAYGKQYTGADDVQSAAQTPPASLEERARIYWEARVAGDLVTTFDLEADKIAGKLTLSQYVRRKGRIVYKNAKVLDTEILGENQAVARLVVEAIVPGLAGALTSEFDDKWVYIDGAWYHGELQESAKK